MTTEKMPPRPTLKQLVKRLRNGRMTWASVLIAGIASCCLGVIGPAMRIAYADDKPGDDPTKTFFEQHCLACHSGSKPKGDFLLKDLSKDFADKGNRLRWLAVLEQVKAGTMPPKARPRPAAE